MAVFSALLSLGWVSILILDDGRTTLDWIIAAAWVALTVGFVLRRRRALPA